MNLCNKCGDVIYREYDLYCPACNRQIDQERARVRNNGLTYGNLWGFNLVHDQDENVGTCHFYLHEDGSLSYDCEPNRGWVRIDHKIGELIKKGFFERMETKNIEGAAYQYMLDNAYYAGSNGFMGEFYISHKTDDITFKLEVNPGVELSIDNDGSISWTRKQIFKDKALMDAYDRGMWEYIENNKEEVIKKIHDDQETLIKEQERQRAWEQEQQARDEERAKENIQYNIATFFTASYIIISSLLLGMIGAMAVLGSFFVAVMIWNSKDDHEHPLTFVLVSYTLFYAFLVSILLWLFS